MHQAQGPRLSEETVAALKNHRCELLWALILDHV